MFSLHRKDGYDHFIENSNHEIQINFLKELIISTYASLNQKRLVFISKEERDFDIVKFKSKHFEITDDFIFLNYSLRARLKNFNNQSEILDFAQVSQTIEKLLN